MAKNNSIIKQSKFCPRCKKTIPFSKFNICSTQSDGYSSYCTKCHREYCKESHRKDPRKSMLKGAKSRAARDGIEFNLKISDIIIPDKCPVFGTPFLIGNRKGGHDYSPSIDRIDPSIGYIKSNISVISLRANAIKNDATPKEIEQLAEYVRESLNKAILP